MLHWVALIPASLPDNPSSSPESSRLVWWALQYTPRVAWLEEALVMETHASHRLFGGMPALMERLRSEAAEWSCQSMACAPTALGALALARGSLLTGADQEKPASLSMLDGTTDKSRRLLAALPLHCLSAVEQHAATLAQLGCRTLGDVARLPRAGLSRRFGGALLQALDQIRGRHPEVLDWLTSPEQFELHALLPHRLDDAQAIGEAAHTMLQSLCWWLGARQAGVLRLTLSWHFDRHKQDLDGPRQCELRLAEPGRNLKQLSRLLDEHLRGLVLAAPVDELWLRADETAPLAPLSETLFASTGQDPVSERQQREAMQTLLARLAVRLGPEAIEQAQVCADHRPEHTRQWRCAMPDTSGRTSTVATSLLPQPCWLLPAPVPLSLSRDPADLHERPIYQGTLHMLAGPHRIEAGWWDADGQQAVARDYYIARSPQAGLVWVFHQRGPHAVHGSPWFLHGLFA